MIVKQLEELFTVLEDRQTKYEKHQKQINTKLDQIIATLASTTAKLDNLTQDFVQMYRNSDKDKVNHTPIVSQNNGHLTFSNIIHATISGLLSDPPGPVHIGTSSTSHPVVDAYTDTYTVTDHVFPPCPT